MHHDLHLTTSMVFLEGAQNHNLGIIQPETLAGQLTSRIKKELKLRQAI